MGVKQQSVGNQSGFTLIELLVVLVIVGVVVTFSLMRIASARASINLNNSAKTLTNYLEKARVDSIRRHPMTTAQMSKIEILNSTSYRVTMDFSGNGVVSSRVVAVENGTSIVIPNDPTTGLPKPANPTFDWRGYNLGGDSIVFTNGTTQVSVSVSDSGDVTLNNSNSSLTLTAPTIATNVNTSTDIKSAAIVNTSSNGCTITTNHNALTIQRGVTASIKVTLGGATGVNSVSAATTSNLISISPASQNVGGNGNADFDIRADKKTGYYAVTFYSPCGAKTVGITVN